jgi:hypothetical protein
VKLLQIVPGFGKVKNGLLDYANALAAELSKKGVVSFYDIEKVGEADAILLNYSGYGYQKRGVPVQLYFRLRKLNRQNQIPLYTYFHEVYAGQEDFFTSSYWLHPLQKKLYKLLYDLSAASFCGNGRLQEIIQSENNGAPRLYLAPLFSNIPVPEQPRKFDDREDVAVVFGTAGRREAVYRSIEMIQRCCKAFGIKSIIDIGDGYKNEWTSSLTVPIYNKGKLDKGDVAGYMSSSKYAFISYPENIFGKSGIFAAYAGNAMCIVNFDSSPLGAKDGLVENQHYINAASVRENSTQNNTEMSSQIFRWYQGRSLTVHANIVSKVIIKNNLADK